MTVVTELPTNGNSQAKTAIERAEREIADENMKRGVEQLKGKLRERDRAKAVLANIEREIADLKEAIEQGNV